MSAKERAQRAAAERERRMTTAAHEGLRQALDSPDGRAFIWLLYSANADAEGPGAKGKRAIARDLMRAAQFSNWVGVQIMREEYEAPRLSVQQDTDADGDDLSA